MRELRVCYRLRHIRGVRRGARTLRAPSVAARLFTDMLGREVVEVCGLLCLNTALHVLAYHQLSRGTLDQVLVCPADVYRIALLTQARVVIVGHNHPSGQVTPSADDVALTRRLVTAGQVLGIDCADHIIVSAEGRYFSFRDAGQL